MKYIISITFFIFYLQVAHAEMRAIFIQLQSSDKGKITAKIVSDVESERKNQITVQEVEKILKKSKGWGSSVLVAIQTDRGLQMSKVMPIFKAIEENIHLNLDYYVNKTMEPLIRSKVKKVFIDKGK